MLQRGLFNILISLLLVLPSECQKPPPPPLFVPGQPLNRCDFTRTDLPTRLKLDDRFSEFITFARDQTIKALCLCVRNTGEISFCEERNICPSHQMLVSFQRISKSTLTVRMLGGFRRKYIAMGFTNDEDDSIRDGELVANAMSSGAPAFMCGFDVALPKPHGTPPTPAGAPVTNPHFTMGYLSKSYRFQRYYGTDDPNSGLITNVAVELKDGLVGCQFTITNPKVRKDKDIPEKTETKNPIDTLTERVYIVMAQGMVNYLKDASPTCWVSDPRIHASTDRHESRFKFNIYDDHGGDESAQYERCSGRNGVARPNYADYCLAFGRDGCLGLTFDCPFFLSVWCDRCALTPPGPSNPSGAPGIGLLRMRIESKLFTSYVGVGWSTTDENDRSIRLENFNMLLICLPIFPSTPLTFIPTRIFEVSCDSKTSHCLADSSNLGTNTVDGNGETDYQIACNIRLDMGTYADIFKEPVTLFMVGSNDPFDPNALKFEFDIQDKEYPENAFFSPHHVTFMEGKGSELYRNDFVLQESLAPDSAELEAVLNLNPTKRTKDGSSIPKSGLYLLFFVQVVKFSDAFLFP